jgi:hypothetical protein
LSAPAFLADIQLRAPERIRTAEDKAKGVLGS